MQPAALLHRLDDAHHPLPVALLRDSDARALSEALCRVEAAVAAAPAALAALAARDREEPHLPAAAVQPQLKRARVVERALRKSSGDWRRGRTELREAHPAAQRTGALLGVAAKLVALVVVLAAAQLGCLQLLVCGEMLGDQLLGVGGQADESLARRRELDQRLLLEKVEDALA